MRLVPFLGLVLAIAPVLPACAQGTDLLYATDSGRSDTRVPSEDTGVVPVGDSGGGGTDTGPAACTKTSGKTCDIFPQCGCAAGQNCNVSTVAGATKCYTAGTVGTHEKCTGNGQCDKGLQCVANVCVPFCKSDADCPMADARCRTAQYDNAGTPTDIPGYDICLAQCDPMNPAATCGANTTCFFPYTDDTTQCALAGTSKSTGGCASDTFACAPGYICVNSGDCLKWCRVGFASDCTGTGGSCTPFTTPPMRSGIEYGVCYAGP